MSSQIKAGKLERLVGLVLLVCSGCDNELCDSADAHFEIPDTGDGVRIVVQACFDQEGVFQIDGSLTAAGNPIASSLVVADGLVLFPRSESEWGQELLVDRPERKDCDPGRQFVLRRLSLGDGISFHGTLKVEAYAPHNTTCSIHIEVSPL